MAQIDLITNDKGTDIASGFVDVFLYIKDLVIDTYMAFALRMLPPFHGSRPLPAGVPTNQRPASTHMDSPSLRSPEERTLRQMPSTLWE